MVSKNILTNYLVAFSTLKRFMYIVILPACLSVQFLHVWCLMRPEEVINSPGTGVTDALNSHVGAELRCGSSEQQDHLGCNPLSALLVSELTIFDFAFSPYFNFFILNYVYVVMGVWMHMNKGLLEARRGSLELELLAVLGSQLRSSVRAPCALNC